MTLSVTYQPIECVECDEHWCEVIGCSRKATRFASTPGCPTLVAVCDEEHPVENIFSVPPAYRKVGDRNLVPGDDVARRLEPRDK